MKILGIDPGFERVGIAVVEKRGAEEVLYSDCFKTKAGLPFPERLTLIGEECKRVITEHKPDTLAIETLIFNKNQKTAMAVAEARGVIMYTAAQAGLDIHEYTPQQIKIAVTGYGGAPKSQVETMVRSLVAIEKSRVLDDEMDAIAIGLTCAASVRYPQ